MRSRISPLASVLIERKGQSGTETELDVVYCASSLKGGRAFAQAILQAQADPQAIRVVYMEMVKCEAVVQASVPIVHSEVITLDEAPL